MEAAPEDHESSKSLVKKSDEASSIALEDRLQSLCLILWRSYKLEEIAIEYVNSETVAITVRSPSVAKSIARAAKQIPRVFTIGKKTPKHNLPKLSSGKYILKISTTVALPLLREKSTNEYVRLQHAIPTPLDLHLDIDTSNNLGLPWLLQRRVQGKPLYQLWPNLNTDQRVSIVKALATCYLHLHSRTYPSGGTLGPETSVIVDDKPVVPILAFAYGPDDTSTPALAAAQHPVDMMKARMQHWQTKDLESDVPDGTPWDALIEIVQALHQETSIFAPRGYYLHHPHLNSHTIFARVINGSGATITGIIGWRNACFVPAIVAFHPPSWLWDGCVGEQQQAVKLMFRAIVDQEFMDMGRQKYARLARKLWWWAVNGVQSAEDGVVIGKVAEAWRKNMVANVDRILPVGYTDVTNALSVVQSLV